MGHKVSDLGCLGQGRLVIARDGGRRIGARAPVPAEDKPQSHHLRSEQGTV